MIQGTGFHPSPAWPTPSVLWRALERQTGAYAEHARRHDRRRLRKSCQTAVAARPARDRIDVEHVERVEHHSNRPSAPEPDVLLHAEVEQFDGSQPRRAAVLELQRRLVDGGR